MVGLTPCPWEAQEVLLSPVTDFFFHFGSRGVSRTKKTLYSFLVPTLAFKGLARDTPKCVVQSSFSYCVPRVSGAMGCFPRLFHAPSLLSLSPSECRADTAESPRDPKEFSLILFSAAAESNSRLRKPAAPTGGSWQVRKWGIREEKEKVNLPSTWPVLF